MCLNWSVLLGVQCIVCNSLVNFKLTVLLTKGWTLLVFHTHFLNSFVDSLKWRAEVIALQTNENMTNCIFYIDRYTVNSSIATFFSASCILVDEFDAYIIVSFVNATLVLSIGDTVEEVTDSGFLGTTPTLSCHQLGEDALLQVSLYFRKAMLFYFMN